MKNIVTAGDYKDYFIDCNSRKKGIRLIKTGLFRDKEKFINKETVSSYELIDEQQKKSVASGIARGVIGGAFLGGVGAIAGAASAKTKGTYTVSVNFKDGTNALCVLDNELYQTLIQILY